MPELPEVQTIVEGLNQKIKNKKILDVWTDWPKYFRLPKGEAAFRKDIIDKKVVHAERRGKNVLIHLSDNHLLLIHQKISGHLIVGKWREMAEKEKTGLPEIWRGQKWIPVPPRGPAMDPMNRFIRLIFFLDKGKMLALSDLRRFAKILCGSKAKIFNLPDLKNLGPEPLDPSFTYAKFKKLFSGKRGAIKQVLMDQNFITGIGNIYSDEILWLAKIHPLARVENLAAKGRERELKNLYDSIKKILNKALKLRGSSVDDYRDAEGKRGTYDLVRYAYQRDGEPCQRCGTEMKRLKVGGRSAHFCPKCQKI